MTTLSPPAGFVEQRRGKILWWLKAGWESLLPSLVPAYLSKQSAIANSQFSISNPQSAIAIKSGRGPIYRIRLEAQRILIVRPYRRGGFIRHLTRNLYWDYPPRPFVELSCTEEVQRRGVPTVEVLGARVEWALAGFYRGLLVTREATGFQDLWSWLQTNESVDLRRQLLTVVAQVIAHMHNAGIAHADLNPTNILVCTDSESPQTLLLDFDRARLFSDPVPPHIGESNLRRFQRFFDKYNVLEEWMTPAEFEHFRQAYEATGALKK